MNGKQFEFDTSSAINDGIVSAHKMIIIKSRGKIKLVYALQSMMPCLFMVAGVSRNSSNYRATNGLDDRQSAAFVVAFVMKGCIDWAS